MGGGVVTCAGAEVGATPVTAYSSERISLLYGSTERGSNVSRSVAAPPEAYVAQARVGQCDAQGRFRIPDLPAGSYFVTTTVNWVVADRPQGGHLMRRVNLGSGENAEILLTVP
jgi:hypothetical protein